MCINPIYLVHLKESTNDVESTMLPEQIAASENSMLSSTFEQSLAERTLCESHAFNANSISTPFSNNIQKQILTPNLSCITAQTPNCVSKMLENPILLQLNQKDFGNFI